MMRRWAPRWRLHGRCRERGAILGVVHEYADAYCGRAPVLLSSATPLVATTASLFRTAERTSMRGLPDARSAQPSSGARWNARAAVKYRAFWALARLDAAAG